MGRFNKRNSKADESADNSIENEHKNFREKMSENIQPSPTDDEMPDLTPKLEEINNQSPLENPTVENEYVSQGRIAGNATESQNKTNNNQSFESEQVTNDEFTATFPPNDSTAPTDDTHTSFNEDSFKIPGETAEDSINWIFEQLNYIIRNYGGVLTDIKIAGELKKELRPEHYEKIMSILNPHNLKNREKIVFTPEEIKMIREPLTKIMAEKGIRGLTPVEQLIVALILVLISKVAAIAEIKRNNKIVAAQINLSISELVSEMRKDRSQNGNGAKNQETKEEESDVVQYEEVKNEG